MLYLISLGLGDKDISMKGMEAAKKCDSLYFEEYTTSQFSFEKLKDMFNNVTLLDRKRVEEGTLVEEAKTKDIGLLVGGDVLAATTHMSLISDCISNGVKYKIIHGSSIITAVGECGLSLYKFGETVTIPRWADSFKPKEFYETILKNHKNGYHSLILMEIDMKPREAMRTLKGLDRENIFSKLVSISNLGSEKQEIWHGFADNMPDLPYPAVLILPGRLNENEKEFLEIISSQKST